MSKIEELKKDLRSHLKNPTGVRMALFNNDLNQLIEAVRKEEKGNIAELIQSDSFAISFQTMGQYRGALIKELCKTTPANKKVKVGSEFPLSGGY